MEAGTGRLLGSVGVGQAPAAAHPGAVYLHQGETYVVDSLDFQDGIAFVHAEDPGYATFAREVTDIAVTGTGERLVFGPVALGLVPVTVTNHVVGYLRRQLSGEVLDFVELDMPEHTLPTTAVMYTITSDALVRSGIEATRIPGSLHAAEHAAIGLLPLVASCDRGDIGGMSTATGPEGCPVSLSTTAIRVEPDSPNAAFAGPAPGWAPPRRPSKPANAPVGVHRVCNPQVRQWQRPVRQGGRGAGAAAGARRVK